MNVNQPTKRFRQSLSMAIIGITLLGLNGCALLQDLLKEVPKPTAKVKGVKFQDISFTDLTLLFDIEIKNPYRVPLPLVNLRYDLATDQKSFLTGKAELQGSVPASGSKIVQLPAKINFKQFLNAVQKVRPGMVVPYTAALDLGVKTPALGLLNLPLKKEGELPIPAVPKVNIEKIAWKNLSLNEASADILFNITNTNDFPININKLNYALSLAGTHVADTGIANALNLENNANQTIKMPIRFSPIKLGFAVFNLLKGEEATYSLNGDMAFKTRFGDFNLPLKRQGKAQFTK